jgi:hypothetical protein
MKDDWNYSIIRIIDFMEDPCDDSAFAISFEVLGPGNLSENIRVSFEDNFLKEYFKIPWFKDFVAEEKAILKKNRPLFIQWALVRIETWIMRGAKEEERKMILTGEKDLDWARRVGEGVYKPQSELRGEQEYIFRITGE